MKKGFLVVISSPSGGGKTTIRRELLKNLPELCYSVSCTTRPPRPGEKYGEDYYFLKEEEFRRRIEKGDFLEWAEVHGFLYGTPRKFIEDSLQEGKIVVMDIDVQGGEKIKRFRLPSVFIFLLPPSWEELKKRLQRRGTEDEETIEKRLKTARDEVKYYHQYDYIVVNKDIGDTVREIEAIIRAEKNRRERQEEWVKRFIQNSE